MGCAYCNFNGPGFHVCPAARSGGGESSLGPGDALLGVAGVLVIVAFFGIMWLILQALIFFGRVFAWSVGHWWLFAVALLIFAIWRWVFSRCAKS
jgi:hypothetical protein